MDTQAILSSRSLENDEEAAPGVEPVPLATAAETAASAIQNAIRKALAKSGLSHEVRRSSTERVRSSLNELSDVLAEGASTTEHVRSLTEVSDVLAEAAGTSAEKASKKGAPLKCGGGQTDSAASAIQKAFRKTHAVKADELGVPVSAGTRRIGGINKDDAASVSLQLACDQLAGEQVDGAASSIQKMFRKKRAATASELNVFADSSKTAGVKSNSKKMKEKSATKPLNDFDDKATSAASAIQKLFRKKHAATAGELPVSADSSKTSGLKSHSKKLKDKSATKPLQDIDDKATSAASAIQKLFRKKHAATAGELAVSADGSKTPGVKSSSKKLKDKSATKPLHDIDDKATSAASAIQKLFRKKHAATAGELPVSADSSKTAGVKSNSKKLKDKSATKPLDDFDDTAATAASAIQKLFRKKHAAAAGCPPVPADTSKTAGAKSTRRKSKEKTGTTHVSDGSDKTGSAASAIQKMFRKKHAATAGELPVSSAETSKATGSKMSKVRSDEKLATKPNNDSSDKNGSAASAIQKMFRKKHAATAGELPASAEKSKATGAKSPRRTSLEKANMSALEVVGDMDQMAEAAANAIQKLFRKKQAAAEEQPATAPDVDEKADTAASAIQKMFRHKHAASLPALAIDPEALGSEGAKSLRRKSKSRSTVLEVATGQQHRRASGRKLSQVSFRRVSVSAVKKMPSPHVRSGEPGSHARRKKEREASDSDDSASDPDSEVSSQTSSDDPVKQLQVSTDVQAAQHRTTQITLELPDFVGGDTSFHNFGDNSARRLEARLSSFAAFGDDSDVLGGGSAEAAAKRVQARRASDRRASGTSYASPSPRRASGVAERRASGVADRRASGVTDRRASRTLAHASTAPTDGLSTTPVAPTLPQLGAATDGAGDEQTMKRKMRFRKPIPPDADVPFRFRRVPRVHLANFSLSSPPPRVNIRQPSGPLLAAIMASGQKDQDVSAEEAPNFIELCSNQPCLRKALVRRICTILPPMQDKPQGKQRPAPSGLTCLVARSTSGAGEGLLARLAEHWRDYKALQSTELKSLQADPKRSPSLAASPNTSTISGGCSRTLLSDGSYMDTKIGAKAVISPTESSLGFLVTRPGYDPPGPTSRTPFRPCWMQQRHRY